MYKIETYQQLQEQADLLMFLLLLHKRNSVVSLLALGMIKQNNKEV